MLIALNIVMAGLVVVGIVALLARSIKADQRATANHTAAPVRPVRAYSARPRTRAGVAKRPAGVHS